jgi:hypothetical protein
MSDMERWRPGSPEETWRKAEMWVFRHGVDAAVKAEEDAQDSQSLDTCSRRHTTRTVACSTGDYGMSRTGGSTTKRELTLRKVALMAVLDGHRIARKYGR